MLLRHRTQILCEKDTDNGKINFSAFMIIVHKGMRLLSNHTKQKAYETKFTNRKPTFPQFWKLDSTMIDYWATITGQTE